MAPTILKAAAFVTLALANDVPAFESFIELHARTYQEGSSEYAERKTLYQQRKADAEEHNSSPSRLWTAGVNKLWDWTDSELQRLRGWDGSMMPEGHGSSRSVRPHGIFLQQTSELPKEKTWGSLESMSYSKNQKDCGSCWAIASTTVLEAHNEIYRGKHQIFSTQQILDCMPNPRHCGGDGGCKGATAELAFDWVLKNGLADASALPYMGHDGKCTLGSATGMTGQGDRNFGMTGWETLPKNQYEPLVRALAERGPVAVTVAADTWFSYEGGIFNGCGKDVVIDHAVVAMGYGERCHKMGNRERCHKYWVIQNSWGDDWGEKGKIKLQRHDEAAGYCGMNNDPQKGVACQGETKPVPVCGMCGVLFDSVVPHFKGK